MTDEQRAEPGDLKVGDFVSWNSSGGRARGRIDRVVRDGTIDVPDSSFTIAGTEDDPAARSRCIATARQLIARSSKFNPYEDCCYWMLTRHR